MTEAQPPYRATVSEQVTAPPHGRVWPRRRAAFFAPPPEEVGPLRSATSTLVEGDRALPASERVALFLVGVPLCMAFNALLAWASGASPQVAASFAEPFGLREWIIGWVAVAAVAAVGAALYATRSQYRVEYVGEEGVAWFTRKAGATTLDDAEVHPFAAAEHLWIERTHVQYYMVTVYTVSALRWTDIGGRAVLRLTDRSASTGEGVATFALAAEVAWTRWRLRQAVAAAAAGTLTELTFPLRKGLLRVTPDALVIELGRREERWDRRALCLYLERGDLVFTTSQTDRSSLRSRGKWRCPAREVGDLRLLLVVLSMHGRALADAFGHAGGPERAPAEPHPLLTLPTHPTSEPDDSRARLRRALGVAACLQLIAIVATLGAYTR